MHDVTEHMADIASNASVPRSARTVELRCNGLTFPVLIWGPDGGRPIVLLHGFPQEPATWTQLADALATDGFQLFAPLQRGYSSSTRPHTRAGYTFVQFVEDVICICDTLGLKSFDVMGFGIAGVQAWMLAANHPSRIRSLISLRYPHPAAFARGIQFDPAQRQKWQQLQEEFGAADIDERANMMLAGNCARLRSFLGALQLPQPFLDRYVERLSDPATFIGAFSWERAISLDSFCDVPAVIVPTLLIWSDGVGLARSTLEATRYYVRAPYNEVVLPGAGHFMLETSSAELLAPIRQHLFST